jgi:hypothetical protein
MQQIHAARRGGWVKWSVGVATAGVLGAALFGGVVSAQKHHLPTGPDAFLHYQVDSTDELVAALRADPALRRRYARHFGIPENRVVDFVRNALVPYRLPAAREVTNYGVTRSGRIYGVRERLRRGTKVWATRSGVPVLKWACANPLLKSLPGTELAAAPRPTRTHLPLHPRVVSAPQLATATSNEMPPATIPVPVPMAPPINTSALAAPLPAPIGVAIAPVPAIAAHGGPGIGSILIPIGIIIGTTVGHTGGGGGGGTPPVAIPEPGSLALMIAAAGPMLGLGVVRRHRRRGRTAGQQEEVA